VCCSMCVGCFIRKKEEGRKLGGRGGGGGRFIWHLPDHAKWSVLTLAVQSLRLEGKLRDPMRPHAVSGVDFQVSESKRCTHVEAQGGSFVSKRKSR
jgi:hypothetical protein